MSDFLPLFAQSAVVALEGCWLTMAVYDNLRHPRLNERGFSKVLSMDLVKADEEVYQEVSGRRVENPQLEKLLFRTLVISEVVVAGLLWLGALLLLLAAFGAVDQLVARDVAIVGVLGFMAIWSSLLIGGTWFWYRLGMSAAMQVHFFLVIWATATLAFLAASP